MLSTIIFTILISALPEIYCSGGAQPKPSWRRRAALFLQRNIGIPDLSTIPKQPSQLPSAENIYAHAIANLRHQTGGIDDTSLYPGIRNALEAANRDFVPKESEKGHSEHYEHWIPRGYYPRMTEALKQLNTPENRALLIKDARDFERARSIIDKDYERYLKHQPPVPPVIYYPATPAEHLKQSLAEANKNRYRETIMNKYVKLAHPKESPIAHNEKFVPITPAPAVIAATDTEAKKALERARRNTQNADSLARLITPFDPYW